MINRCYLYLTRENWHSGDLDPGSCGPLTWTPYPARSLYAGKQAGFNLPLKDSSGFVKSTTTGPLSSADAKTFLSALTLSFTKQISNLTSKYVDTQGTALVMFLPITCGTWTASAGVKAWPGIGASGATFYGSPFTLTIKAGPLLFFELHPLMRTNELHKFF